MSYVNYVSVASSQMWRSPALIQTGLKGLQPAPALQKLTVLPEIHAHGVGEGDVGVRRSEAGAGVPHVEEDEDWDGGEAEDGQESQSQDVGQNHELQRAGGDWESVKTPLKAKAASRTRMSVFVLIQVDICCK